MAGEKMAVAVPEYRQPVGPFDVVTMDTVRNIYQLGQALEGQGVPSQEGSSVSFADFLRIDEDAFNGAPGGNDAFPFQTRGNITVPIVQQMSSANLSNVLYPVFASAEAFYHGYKKGYRGKIGRADKFIEALFEKRPLTAEELRKHFEEEAKKEAGGKKGAPEGVVPKEVRELGGRKGISEYLVKSRLCGMPSYKTVPAETFDNLFTEYNTLAKRFQNYAIESERHIRDGKIDIMETE